MVNCRITRVHGAQLEEKNSNCCVFSPLAQARVSLCVLGNTGVDCMQNPAGIREQQKPTKSQSTTRRSTSKLQNPRSGGLEEAAGHDKSQNALTKSALGVRVERG